MTYRDICQAHQRYHCIDCGYVWYTDNGDGTWTVIEGTGAEV